MNLTRLIKTVLVIALLLYLSSQTVMRGFFSNIEIVISLSIYVALGCLIFLIVRGFATNASKTIVLCILVVASVIMAAPFVWMILSSFKTNPEILRAVPTIFPEKWTLEHYRNVLGISGETIKNYNFGKFYFNSFKIAVIVTVISAFANAFIGFVFAKYKFAGKRICFSITLATMMIPFPVTIIPMFLIMGKAHLLDTHIALIIPGMIGAYGIFLIHQFVKTIPDDLFDAARIDGCSELRLYSILILPSCKPIMFALSLFTFIASWNNVVWPLILLQTQEKYTLPLALMTFSDEYNLNYGLILAATAITVIPVIVLFLFVQKHFVKSITMSGLKS